MQRIWVVVLSVWAMLAIVAVLAWSSRPVVSPPPASAQTVKVVKGPAHRVARGRHDLRCRRDGRLARRARGALGAWRRAGGGRRLRT